MLYHSIEGLETVFLGLSGYFNGNLSNFSGHKSNPDSVHIEKK